MSLEARVNKFWYPSDTYRGLEKMIYQGSGPLQRQLSQIILRRMRQRQMLEQCTHDEPLIVVVGNITVGGTGKTPVIMGLVKWLQAKGYKPAIISRGYRKESLCARLRSTWSDKFESTVVYDSLPADRVGDEPKMLYERTQVPVVVNKKRQSAVQTIRDQFPEVDVILSDDGLQHYDLPRHLEIVVVDGERGFGNGQLLPTGPLREPLSRLNSVSAIVVNQTADGVEAPGDGASSETVASNFATKIVESIPSGRDLFSFHLSSLGFYRVMDDSLTSTLEGPVTAITGIGNPKRFFYQLRSMNLELAQLVAMPDHHQFELKDFDQIDSNRVVVMTEKDSVKCRPFAKKNWYYLKVETEFSPQFIEFLEQNIPAK